jgi:hypothetical protein
MEKERMVVWRRNMVLEFDIARNLYLEIHRLTGEYYVP